MTTCPICKGTYESRNPDGSKYFHACHPDFKNGRNENLKRESQRDYLKRENNAAKKQLGHIVSKSEKLAP